MKKKENPFEKYGTEEIKEINKSDIFDAMREPVMPGVISIEKTGKEIKDQVNNVILPKLMVNFEEQTKKLNDLLTLTGTPPEFPIKYYKVKLDLPFNEYTWEECHYCNHGELKGEEELVKEGAVFDNFANVEGEFESDSEDIYFEKNYPVNKEQAEARCNYNENLHILMEIAVDIKAAQVLTQITEDNVYRLNVNQSIALGF